MGTQRKRVKTLRTAVTALSVFGQFQPETAQAAACDSAACLGDKMIRMSCFVETSMREHSFSLKSIKLRRMIPTFVYKEIELRISRVSRREQALR